MTNEEVNYWLGYHEQGQAESSDRLKLPAVIGNTIGKWNKEAENGSHCRQGTEYYKTVQQLAVDFFDSHGSISESIISAMIFQN